MRVEETTVKRRKFKQMLRSLPPYPWSFPKALAVLLVPKMKDRRYWYLPEYCHWFRRLGDTAIWKFLNEIARSLCFIALQWNPLKGTDHASTVFSVSILSAPQTVKDHQRVREPPGSRDKYIGKEKEPDRTNPVLGNRELLEN